MVNPAAEPLIDQAVDQTELVRNPAALVKVNPLLPKGTPCRNIFRHAILVTPLIGIPSTQWSFPSLASRAVVMK